jgi:hypothetical protein
VFQRPLLPGISGEKGVIGTPALREFTHNDLVATIDRLFDKGLLRSSRKTRHKSSAEISADLGVRQCGGVLKFQDTLSGIIHALPWQGVNPRNRDLTCVLAVVATVLPTPRKW